MSIAVGVKQSVIGTAAREYFTRPNDEKFPSLDALIGVAATDKANSRERGYNLKDLRVEPVEDGIKLQSPKGEATVTAWAFNQLSTILQSPAGFLRKLSAPLLAAVLNERIEHSDVGSTATLLVKADSSRPLPVVRSITSESYGRLWDADLVRGMRDTLGATFKLPPIWEGGNGGAYRGDRDSFVLLVDGGSIVNDPSARQDGRMYRGIMVRNSEVGAAGVVLERVLFEYICGNLNLWGAVIDKRYRRRHVGSHVLRDVLREIGRAAYDWTNRTAAQDEKLIRLLLDTELANTREAVIDELRKMGATKEQAETAYATCEQSDLFNASPRSYWGLAQGMTRASQASAYQDERFELDTLASKLLQQGARVVA